MRECPFCGTKINNDNAPCPGCNYGGVSSRPEEIIGEATEVDSQTIIEPEPQPQRTQNPSVNYEKKLSGWLKFLSIILSLFFSPVIGIIIAIVLMVTPYPRYKNFGIILMIISIIAGIFLFFANVLLGAAYFLF